MTASDLLSQLRELGVEIKVSGDDRLIIDAPKGAITPELRSELASHKPELLQILRAEQTPASSVAPQVVAASVAKVVAKPEQSVSEPATAIQPEPTKSKSEEIDRLEAELVRLRAEEAARRG